MQLIENKGQRRSLIDAFCKCRAPLVSVLALAACCVLVSSCGSSGVGNPPVAPTIATQPANQSVNVNQTATFTVVANGTAPLNYQWQQGTTNIPGANSASYTTPAVTQADNGSTFRVVVTNGAGNVTSNPATLTVTSGAVKPTITTQPANQSVNVNQTATFTVVASGTAPLTYQWQQGTTNIPNSNSPSYTTPPTTISESGSTFQVVVSNSAGSATSNTATLTVNNPAPGNVNVLTYHNDNARTGQNLNETILTTTNVNSATFGKLGFFPVDGLVDAEPLLVSNLMIGWRLAQCSLRRHRARHHICFRRGFVCVRLAHCALANLAPRFGRDFERSGRRLRPGRSGNWNHVHARHRLERWAPRNHLRRRHVEKSVHQPDHLHPALARLGSHDRA